HIGMRGFVNSGGVVVWALFAPLMVMLVRGTRQALPWLFACIAMFVFAAVIFPGVEPGAQFVPPYVSATFFALNFSMIGLITFLGLRYFALRIEQEQAKQHAASRELARAMAQLEE